MIHILQLLCPQRHCFVALAWDDRNMTLPEAAMAMGRASADLLENHRLVCDLCGATSFKLEDGLTKYGSIDEAEPALRVTELAQQLTRQVLKDRN